MPQLSIAGAAADYPRVGSDDIVRAVVAISQEIACTPAQVAISWVRQQPGPVIPLIAARTDEEFRDNLLAALPLAAVVVEARYAALFKLEHVGGGWLADQLARLAVRYPEVRVAFADSRPFAEDWTYRFLAAAIGDGQPRRLRRGCEAPRSRWIARWRRCDHARIVPVRLGLRLRAAFEAGAFGPLGDLYAEDAVLDWSLPGRRAHAIGSEAVVAQLGEWWRGRGELTRWDESAFPSGLTIEFERRADGALARQRHFIQTVDGRIVRHQAYCARPHGATVEPLEDAAVDAARAVGEIDRREPLTHAGQSGAGLERIVLVDGRRLVVKRSTGEDWVARTTRDDGREVGLWEQGVLARMPPEIDPAVLDAGRDGRAGWLLMRDVSGELLPADRRLSREESTRILAAAAALHRRFAGESISGLCSLEDRITLTSPATVAGEAPGVDYLPKMLVVGWEVFADAVPDDVAAAIFGAMEQPEPLAALLRDCTATLVHNDLRGANLGLLPGRIVVLDWGLAGSGPPELEFAWYLFVNGWRIDATREQLIDDFKRVEGDLHDPRALELSWIAQLCWHGPLLAHELVEASEEKRNRARTELAWWVERVRAALELL